jgi:hypothetical protein
VGERLRFEVEFAAELIVHPEHRLEDGLVLAPVWIRNYLVFKQGRGDGARRPRSQAPPLTSAEVHTARTVMHSIHSPAAGLKKARKPTTGPSAWIGIVLPAGHVLGDARAHPGQHPAIPPAHQYLACVAVPHADHPLMATGG